LYATCEPGKPLTIEPESEPYEVSLFSSKAGLTGASLKLAKQIASGSKRYDLVHIHSLWNQVATCAAAAARRARLPYVLSPRGMLDQVCLERRRTLKRLYAMLFERRTIEGAALLHFLNDAEAESPRVKWFRFPGHFVASNGIGLTTSAVERGEFRRRFPGLKDRRLMIFLGRLHPIKGLDLQLQALSLLVRNDPRVLWLLIGPDDGEWQRLRKAIQGMGLEEHAQWLGPMMGQERLSALADADVVVQTSLYECHSMAVGEAMALGAPLVITDTVNRPEVERVGAGRVVSRDAAELARAIEEIFQSPERARLMREAGRRFAAQYLDWANIAHNMNAVYNELLYGSSMTGEADAVPVMDMNSCADERGTELLPERDVVA
jgi:glycosyltransferase involved in cell wall biosynthesis